MSIIKLGSIPFTLILIFFSIGLLGCNGKVEGPDLDDYPVKSGVIDGKEFFYRVYIPESKDNSEKPPVVLYLHGAGNRGSDNASQLNGLDSYIRQNKALIDFILVIPQLPKDRFWDAEALEMANAAMDATVKEYDADVDRLGVMGFSIGGNGVWSMAVMYPGKFAALVPMAARVIPTNEEMPKVAKDVADIANDPNNFKLYAEKIGQTAVWIFHGSDDEVISDGEAHAIQDAMRTGGNKKANMMTVVRGGHSPLAFNNTDIIDWIMQQRKEVQ